MLDALVTGAIEAVPHAEGAVIEQRATQLHLRHDLPG
jgi:hypothetical protein